MDITLDIEKRFNTVINHEYFFDGPSMEPVLFLNISESIYGEYEIELMNFGLNIHKEMEESFMNYSPDFDDIVRCTYEFKSLLIFGKAILKFSGIKGADLKLAHLSGEKLYYTWPYKIVKDDYLFSCGGYSPFSAHYMLLNLIANSNASATITFSSSDYLLLNNHSYDIENMASSRQTRFSYVESNIGDIFLNKCSVNIAKSFDFNYYNRYFRMAFTKNTHTTRAIASEK